MPLSASQNLSSSVSESGQYEHARARCSLVKHPSILLVNMMLMSIQKKLSPYKIKQIGQTEMTCSSDNHVCLPGWSSVFKHQIGGSTAPQARHEEPGEECNKVLIIFLHWSSRKASLLCYSNRHFAAYLIV